MDKFWVCRHFRFDYEVVSAEAQVGAEIVSPMLSLADCPILARALGFQQARRRSHRVVLTCVTPGFRYRRASRLGPTLPTPEETDCCLRKFAEAIVRSPSPPAGTRHVALLTGIRRNGRRWFHATDRYLAALTEVVGVVADIEAAVLSRPRRRVQSGHRRL